MELWIHNRSFWQLLFFKLSICKCWMHCDLLVLSRHDLDIFQ